MAKDLNKMDIAGIMAMIPHRYPFLLVDRIIDFTKDKSITGVKNITFNEPQFMGHFPDNPVMPGVLIIEAMAQVSAVLVAKSMDTTKDKVVYFMSIDKAKFRKIVQPGDTMLIHSKVEQSRAHAWRFSALAEVEGEVVAESIFTAMVKSK